MIDIKHLKNNKDFYLKSFANKGLVLNTEVEKAINLYDSYKSLLLQEQAIREQLNLITSEIKNDPKNNELKLNAKNVSLKANEITSKVNTLNNEINNIISFFPNPSDNDVPIGKDEDDNIIISTFNDDKLVNKFAKSHWEIIEENNMILGKEAGFISGARHIIYNDKTALVVKALEKLMIDNAIENDYKLIEPPVLVNKDALFNTGQLPKFEEDLFKVGEQYLIPTAEVPLTNLVANKLLDKEQLPMNFVGSTSCFRKEAGSAGKDTRGLIRLHQFRKVELVTIGNPNDEKNDLSRMIKTATSILDKLELPYRLVQLCTGDSSFTSKKTIDIEVWMPGVKTYREISSISSIGDFQSRRMKTRFKDENGNKQLVYTYNGSGLAIGRTLAAIIENYVQENGMIKVPQILQKYLSFKEF